MATYLSPETLRQLRAESGLTQATLAERIGQTLADKLSADQFEITPAQPHSDAGLIFHNETSPSFYPDSHHKRQCQPNFTPKSQMKLQFWE